MHCLILSTAGKNSFPRTEGNRSCSVIPPYERLETRATLQTADIPKADERIFTTAGQGAQAVAGVHIPQAYTLIIAPTGHHLPIRAEGDSTYRSHVALKHPQAIACLHVPDT